VCGLRPVMRASSGMLTRAAATASCSIMAGNLASTEPAYKNLVEYALVEYIGGRDGRHPRTRAKGHDRNDPPHRHGNRQGALR
jgi:hypothetical protein